MSAEENAIAANFLAYSAKRLEQLQKTVATCCDKLAASPNAEELMAHRGGDHENSINNLLLHLAGNLRQWIMHGVGGQPDVRERDAEFSLSATTTSVEARQIFDIAIEEAARIVAAVDPGRLLTVIDPQPTGTWRNPTLLEAIYKVVAHVDHHTGQIIVLTKQMTAADLNLSMPRKR